MSATPVARRGGIHRQWREDFGAAGGSHLERQVEIRRKDADDFNGLAIQRNRAADNPGIRGEHPPPESVAQDRDRRRIGHGLLGPECPAQRQRSAKNVQRRDSDRRGTDPLRVSRCSRNIDGARGHGRERHRAALFRVVQELRVREARRRASVPPVPDRDETLGLSIRQGTQQHRIHDTEDRRVGANPERERNDGDRHEPNVPSHATKGVCDVLAELIQMFTRSDGQYVAHSLSPHAQQSCHTTVRRLAPLLAKDLRHFRAVVRPHVERQQVQQLTKPAIPAHTERAFGMSFFARAMPSAVSIRWASARATRRPKSVSR